MPRGGARKQATLKFEREAYYLDALKGGSLTLEQMKSEYKRLSSVARQRLARFEQSKEWKDADIYREYAGSFEQPVTSLNEAQLMRELSDLAQFTSSKLSSIRGQQQNRNQIIQTLHARGYTFINKNNFKDFTNFMDEIQTLYQERKYPPSEELVEIFKESRKRNVQGEELMKHLDEWLEYRKEISKLTKKETQGFNSKQILALAKKKRKK